MHIEIAHIRIDGQTQPPDRLCEETVGRYAEILDQLPPIVVFRDGGDFWLADGFHRYHAARKAGRVGMEAEVRTGTRTDARVYAASANAAHGKVRTRAELHWWIDQFIANEGKDWTNRRIADVVGCDDKTVAARRKSSVAEVPQHSTRKGADGREYRATKPPTPTRRPPPPMVPDATPRSAPKPESPVPDATPMHDARRMIIDAKSAIKALGGTPPAFHLGQPRITEMMVALDQISAALRDHAPAGECPQWPNCKRGCQICHRTGWLSKRLHDNLPGDEK